MGGGRARIKSAEVVKTNLALIRGYLKVGRFVRQLLTWNIPNAVPRCSFVRATVVTIITLSPGSLSFSLLPFPRPGRALSFPLLLYSSPLPPSLPLSHSLFFFVSLYVSDNLFTLSGNEYRVYICVCVCVSDARKTAKQRKNRAPDTAGSQ